MKSNRARRAALSLAGSTLFLLPGAALAQSQQQFNISGGSLSTAIKAFLSQTGEQLLVSEEMLANRRSLGAQGMHRPNDALEIILRNSGLKAVRSGHGVIYLRPIATKTAFASSVQAAPVPAQDVGRLPAASSVDPAVIDDIVVTARRREESAQKVPASIQVFDTQALVRANIRQVSDLATQVPGFTLVQASFGGGFIAPMLRGARNANNQITYDAPVAVYVNDVVLTRGQGLNEGLYDIANVQILKGPQGTLFGRNSSGGALLITTQKPTAEMSGYATVNYGNYDYKTAEAALNLPVADWLQLRVAGMIKRRDGVYENPTAGRKIGNMRSEGWRASIRLAPSDMFENLLVYSGSHVSQDNSPMKLIATTPAVYPASLAPLADYANHPFYYTTTTNYRHGTDVKTHIVSNTSTANVGDITFKNIFGYSHLNAGLFIDLSGSSAHFLDSLDFIRDDTYSDEFQILGKAFDQQLNWIVGGYWLKETGKELQRTRFFTTNTIGDFQQTTHSHAVFAQATFRPHWADDKLSLTAGARYTWDRKDFTSRNRLANAALGAVGDVHALTPDFFGGPCRLFDVDVGGTPISPCLVENSVKSKEPTYTLAADYQLAPKILIYAAHRHGYQAGGFSHSATRPTAMRPYRPQKVDDFEVGTKTDYSLGDVAARTNMTLYHAKYSEIQRLALNALKDVNGNTIGFTNAVINAGRAVVQGVEFEQRFRVRDWMDVGFVYAYTDAHYTKFVDASGADYTASKFGAVPAHMATGSVRFKLPVSEALADTHWQLDGSYQSHIVTNDQAFNPVTQQDAPFAVQPGYFLLNTKLDFEQIAGSQIRVSLWGKNILNKKYYNGGNNGFSPGGSGHVYWGLGTPRTYGIELSSKF
jgi:iron complex outermembrane receptor protein